MFGTIDIADKKENIKDVLLWGSHGTGKTMVGAEVAKMKLEQIFTKQKFLNALSPNLFYVILVLEIQCHY